MSIRKRLEVPRAFKPLLQPKRYKGAYGGRGSAKSHFFAEQLIRRCSAARIRCVCIREVQNSIRESVRQLLIDKIAKFDLGALFSVLESEIRGRNGSLIIFKGMQSYNSENIKSLEGYDIAWVEEAQNLSEPHFACCAPPSASLVRSCGSAGIRAMRRTRWTGFSRRQAPRGRRPRRRQLARQSLVSRSGLLK